MNVEIVNPFISSTLNVLKTMAFTEATPGQPRLKEGKISLGDVTGFSGLAGEQLSGSFSISFTQATILAITSSMFGEVLTQLNEEVHDAVGEITNMISGGARKQLTEMGYKFNMSIPSVIVGHEHQITHRSKGKTILLPFSIDAGDFFVEICLEA